MHIAVIGAGAAGLAAARHAIATDGVEVTVFEQSDRVGGTWVYTDAVGEDEFGVPVSSSMYYGLHTNGPKEVMCYPDVPFDSSLVSFCKSEDVLAYLVQFAQRFDLASVIRFRHQVLNVKPIADSTRWSVTVRDVLNRSDITSIFDAVLVCNGQYSEPAYPADLLGRDLFRGQQLHSHAYRRTDAFAGKRVLVIGSASSGTDISWMLKDVVAKLRISCRGDGATSKIASTFGEEVQRPDVAELTESGAKFVDGREEDFDVVLYCTGYFYKFPFLADECGITAEDNHVRPLFKQCVHIERPTMFFLGLTSFDLPFLGMDTQARFAMALLKGKWKLPAVGEMRRIAEEDLERCWANGYSKWQAHKIVHFIPQYIGDLVRLAGLPAPRPVLFKLFDNVVEMLTKDWKRFRQEQYTIVDDETFTHYNLLDVTETTKGNES